MALINLEGKVALVSGASRGIGESIALAFAEAGAKVAVSSRKEEGVAAVARKIVDAGGEALPVAAHVGHPAHREDLLRSVTEHFGKLDVLVNCAGTNPYFGPAINIDECAYEKTFQVNLTGAFELSRALARHLVDRGAPGSIVNIASVAGIRAMPLQAVYGMTKAAMIQMTRTMAMELGPSGIRVNAIAPGLINTRLASAIVGDPTMNEMITTRAPLGRIGDPEEVAGGVLYLASDAASYTTGQTLVIDGGITLV